MTKKDWFRLFMIINLFIFGWVCGHERGKKATFSDYLDRVQEANTTTWKEGYEVVEVTIVCECANILIAETPMDDEVWPLTYFCARCKMRYTMTKENRPPEINEWYKEYGHANGVAR